MKYTVRFCHMEEPSERYVGEVIGRGEEIGRMGDTGMSYGAHLHLDIVEGLITEVYRLHMINSMIRNTEEALTQLRYFLDDELFKVRPEITTYFGDPGYGNEAPDGFEWIYHPAYDVVPHDRHELPGEHYDIFWPRSYPGLVVAKGFDSGYGNYIHIMFEV